MFVNFASLKNVHPKKFYFKCPGLSKTILHRNCEEVAIYCEDVRSYSAATLPKYCKCVQLLNKSEIQQFHILRRILSTNCPLFKQNQGSTNDTNNPDDKGFIRDLALTTAAIFGILFILRTRNSFSPPYISWEEFKREILAKGEVKSLTIFTQEKAVRVELQEGAVIKNIKARPVFVTPFSPGIFALEVADIRKFEERLREAEEDLGISATDRVPISYIHSKETGIWPLLLALAIVWFISRSNKFSFRGKGYTDLIFPLRPRYTLIDPLMGHTTTVKFSDVAGLKEAKTEIMDFVDYLKRPEIYRSLGARVPKGALLLGPPGCGKTLLAKAVATEANVPFLSMNGSEFMELIGGLGAARVRGLFKIAKKRSPCIVYIDEIDAIGKKRVSFEDAGGEAEQTLNQLLVEMDGVVSNEGVLLLASTNRADVLDNALLRPGRFDRRILIDLPTFQERQEIFEHHLKSVHLEEKPETYSKRMAHLTAGFSGADIANVCNEAALHAARLKKQIVQGDDLEYAVERAVGGTEKRTSCRTPEEKKLFAYYEAGRALVGWLSKYGEALIKITIVARTESPAGWTHFSPVDKSLYSEDDLRGKMCMGLGGRVAITVLFNRVTTAGEKDLKKVTNLAYAQVRRFGMNKNVGLMSFDINETDDVLKKPYSKVLGNLYDHEVRKLVTETYKEAEKIILENKDKLIKLAEELLVKETLNYDDVVKLIGPPAFEGKTLVEPLEFIKSLDQAVGTDNTT